jgi:hypothetical protein
LEQRLSAVPLMTAADAARYAQVNVETLLRAVRAGELSVAGYVGRSPTTSWPTPEPHGNVIDEPDEPARLAGLTRSCTLAAARHPASGT